MISLCYLLWKPTVSFGFSSWDPHCSYSLWFGIVAGLKQTRQRSCWIEGRNSDRNAQLEPLSSKTIEGFRNAYSAWYLLIYLEFDGAIKNCPFLAPQIWYLSDTFTTCDLHFTDHEQPRQALDDKSIVSRPRQVYQSRQNLRRLNITLGSLTLLVPCHQSLPSFRAPKNVMSDFCGKRT